MRMFAPQNILFPNFIWAVYAPGDWRYYRNVQRFRAEIRKIITDRRNGATKSNQSEDLISILLESDFFTGGDDNMIIDEIITFFLAGMKTIQISTTNLIYFMTKHPEYKAKLEKEVLPAVESAKSDIVNNLEYETVMEFEYLQMCYNEALRMEPPAANSIAMSVTQDTEVK